ANSTGLPNSCLLLDSALKGCIGVRICTAGPNIVKLPIRTGQTSRTTQRPVRAPSGRTVQSSSRNAIRWRFQGNSARGERAHNALLPVAQKPESELDVKLAAVLVPRPRDDRRAVQARLSRLDGALVAAPMRRAQMFRDDEVEAFANRLARGVAEQRFRARVPDADRALAVGEDDGIGRLLDDGLQQIRTRQRNRGIGCHSLGNIRRRLARAAQQLHLDVLDRSRRTELFRADLGAVHDRAAAVELVDVVEESQALGRSATAAVDDEALGLQQTRRADELVRVPPVGGAEAGAAGA